MSEKKIALYDLKVSYNGPINIEEFFAEMNRWMEHNDYEKEPKKHLEHVTKDGKQIEWLIETKRKLSDIFESILILRVLFNNVREIVVVKNGKRLKANYADALVTIDGVLEGRLTQTWWHGKVVFQFIRTLIDKYIYNFWTFKYEGVVQADAHKLFKHIRSFLSLQKYKYQNHQ